MSYLEKANHKSDRLCYECDHPACDALAGFEEFATGTDTKDRWGYSRGGFGPGSQEHKYYCPEHIAYGRENNPLRTWIFST